MPNTPAPFICSKCNRPIRNDGLVEIYDTASGGYPVEASPEFEPSPSEHGFRDAGIVMAEYTEYLMSPPKVSVRAVHFDCRDDEFGGYQIPVSRATDAENWLAWLLHLQEKRWIGPRENRILMYFWWTGRGQEIPSV